VKNGWKPSLIVKYEQKCKEAHRHCDFVNMWVRSPSEISYWVNATASSSNSKSVIVGERGISGIERIMLGSVSNAILHESSVPVVVVKGEKRPYNYSDERMAPIMSSRMMNSI